MKVNTYRELTKKLSELMKELQVPRSPYNFAEIDVTNGYLEVSSDHQYLCPEEAARLTMWLVRFYAPEVLKKEYRDGDTPAWVSIMERANELTYTYKSDTLTEELNINDEGEIEGCSEEVCRG